MAVWTLNVEDRAALAARIAKYEKDLVVAWLAAEDRATAQYRVLAVVVRPPLPQERAVEIVTDRVILYSATVSATEAGAQIAERTVKGPLRLSFELVGDHSPQPYWLSSDTTGFGFAYSPPWPQFYVSWSLDGVQELAQRVTVWEPISTTELAFDHLRDAIAAHMYGMPLQPMLLNAIEPSLIVRLPYPVRLGAVAEHSRRLVVEIEEDSAGAAAGHSILVGIRETEADPTFHQTAYPVDQAGPVEVLLAGSIVKAVIRLRNLDHEERDRKEWVPAAQPLAEVSPSQVPAVAIIRSPDVSPQDRVTREPAPDFGPICDEVSWVPMLSTRWEEAQRARGAQANLAAIIMMGSLLEGALLALCSKRAAVAVQFAPKAKQGSKPMEDWTLADLMSVARLCGWLSKDRADFAHVLRDYRNLVHPRRQAQLGIEPDSQTADICWQVTRAVVHDLLRLGGSVRS